MKCKICGGQVWSGALLHTHCLEKIDPKWHPAEERPPMHIEIVRVDDEDTPFEVSEELLCEYGDKQHDVAQFCVDDAFGDAWIKKDGTVIKVTRWMQIPD